VRSWFVIPAAAIACGGAALALGVTPAAALTGAALAAVVRVLAGDSPAALTGAVLAPLVAVASFADAGGAAPRAALAMASAGWAVTELAARATEPSRAQLPRSLVAVIAAALAAILDPSFVALVAITGARLVPRAPAPRPRWALAVPAAGILAVALAVVAATAWPALGSRWFGAAHPRAHPMTLAALAALTGAALGPITSAAALGGLAFLARARAAELALAAAIAGAVLVDLRAGAVGAVTIGLAALLAGLAIARLAAMIRIPSAQAIAGATLGVLMVVPPVWAAVAQRSPVAVAHTGHASR
jgi:hypothetical protein